MRSTITRPGLPALPLWTILVAGTACLLSVSGTTVAAAPPDQPAAQTPPARQEAAAEDPNASAPPEEEDAADTMEAVGAGEPAEDSPRVSLQRYLDLCRDGRYDEAARYLDAPPARQAERPELARKLKAVLDRHIWFDLDAVSGRSGGDPDDGLPAGTDQLGVIPGAGGGPVEPVRFTRHEAPDGALWMFSRATVRRIQPWYDRLDNRWALEHLPEPLLRPGPRDLLWWQWIALPLVLAAAWGIGRILSGISQALLRRLAGRTTTHWDDAIVGRIVGPLTLAWTIFGVYVVVPWLDLYEPAQALVNQVMRVGIFLVFFWSLLRTVDILGQMIIASPRTGELPALRSLVPLGARTVKVAILAMAVISVVSDLGYPVTSLLAGLSIGGLALALAAQKTGENIFGAYSLGVDQPFREGDFVKIEDFVGTVETIGLRSTRFRTLDRTLISIPNGKLADMRLESFTARDRLRLACTIGLVYETTSSQMREVLEGLERVLREHPQIWPDAVVVRFKEFGASSLDIEIMAWFQTSVWSEFQLIRQGVLLQFMEVVEKAGTSFAFPTRTVHLVGQKD